MAIPSAHGGHAVVGGSPNVTVPVGMWAGNFGGLLGNVTTSGSGGGTRYAPVVQDPQFSVEIPWDSVVYPDAIGWEFGAVIANMYLLIGGSGKCVHVQNATVAVPAYQVDPRADVPRVTVQFQGGTATLDAANPS